MEKSEEKGPEKSERKLYKGAVVPVKDLEKGLDAATPVQPVNRKYRTGMGYEQTLPPSFLVTKFTSGFQNHTRLMHVYEPKNNLKTSFDVPVDLELNVLSGERGKALAAQWKEAATKYLARIARRISCTIGTDPEIFVVDQKGVVPAWTFLGSKEKPDHYRYEGYTQQGVYWDGFQAEFTTPAGITCLVEMGRNVRQGLRAIHEKKPSGSALSPSSVLPVEPKILAKAKEEYVAFGCAPSRNLYGLKGNIQDGRMVPYRFAGGHIHFGLDDTQKKAIPDIVQALDSVLAVACVSLFADYDSPVRRKFYGQAGEYRLPPHGLEYRVLSNAWLIHPVAMNMVFDLARAVAGVVVEGLRLRDVWDVKEEEMMRAVMNSDVDFARSLLERNKDGFSQILAMAGAQYQRKAAKVWTQGIHKYLTHPKNVSENWCLDNGHRWPSFPYSYSTAVSSFEAGKKV